MALSVTPTDEMKTLTVGGKIYEIVDDKAREDVSEVKADLLQKANIDGAYSDLTAGNAEQLVSTVYEEDSVPYLFRTAGGSMDIGDREEDMLVGGTVAWNQLVWNGDFAVSTRWAKAHADDALVIADGVATMTIGSVPVNYYAHNFQTTLTSGIAGHKYLLFAVAKSTKDTISIGLTNSSPASSFSKRVSPNTWTQIANIVSISGSYNSLQISPGSTYASYEAGDTIQAKAVTASDLTQAFGSTIADYIYSLERATAGAGVAWFRKLFPADYYPYDAGTLKSVEGVSSHDMVGFNAYNPTTGTAKLVGGQQYQITGAYSALTLDGEAVTPDASGYFTPTKSGTLTVTGGNSTTTCVHLVWDGERDGECEPYVKRSYPLDSSLTLRGIPKLDSANNLYYDGDTYESDGTVTRRYGIVDLGALNWTKRSENASRQVYGTPISTIKQLVSDTVIPNLITPKYKSVPVNASWADGDISMASVSDSNVVIITGASAYPDVASFKASLSGQYLVYELATPTTETAEHYQNPQIVDDFGTEEYVTTSIVPVGHVTKYQPNLRAKLEMSPDSPDGDGDYIVRQANGENSYVSLASTATIQDILARLTALEGNTNEG